jgi:hypothetical protein
VKVVGVSVNDEYATLFAVASDPSPLICDADKVSGSLPLAAWLDACEVGVRAFVNAAVTVELRRASGSVPDVSRLALVVAGAAAATAVEKSEICDETSVSGSLPLAACVAAWPATLLVKSHAYPDHT